MTTFTIAGACDCHVHVVGTVANFPQIANRSYTAEPATLESLRAVAEPLGVSRFVIVQPSFYGTDNACLLKTLDNLGGLGRGVAVVDPAVVNASALEGFALRGVCGLRLNLYSFAVSDAPRKLEQLLAKASEIMPRIGWHLEIIADIGTLTAAAQEISKCEIPIMIDHYGLPANENPESYAGRALLDLLADPNVWIKLSAPYRCSEDPLTTSPPSNWLRAILRVAPDRCVWGSDWPHTPLRDHGKSGEMTLQYRNIIYARSFGDFVAALPTPEMARRILIENPIRAYGFPDTFSTRFAGDPQAHL